MNPGKVSNTVLKRSVLKNMKKRGEHLEAKPSIGSDCAVLKGDSEKSILLSTTVGRWAVYAAANNISAKGGTIAAVQCGIVLSERTEETELKAIAAEIERQCQFLNIPISGGHTQVSSQVKSPIVQITGIGYGEAAFYNNNIDAGQDIIAAGIIGISGIRTIAELKKNDILERYSQDIIDIAAGDETELLSGEAAAIGIDAGVSMMHDVSSGGIFAALWDMAEYSRVGIDVDFKAIPVRQEVIEICEIFDVNPYELESLGCLLMTSNNGCDIVKLLAAKGIPAAVIGRTIEGNQKIIRNQEEIRYLDNPHTDEIHRFILS